MYATDKQYTLGAYRGRVMRGTMENGMMVEGRKGRNTSGNRRKEGEGMIDETNDLDLVALGREEDIRFE